ncbi:mediator of RNA polymerase II transcription subunit 24 [Cloeon dipterum]
METKITSKTSSLQALLLRAWRERWNDLQWGIQIKTVLPRGVSGDVHNLADCILQQALVGPGPNQLVLSYLKHSLSSQLVSYAAVLQRISKYDGVNKPHCVISLLELVEAILGRMTCRSKAEEGALASAVLSLVSWLTMVAMHAYKKLVELGSSPEHTTMFVRSTAMFSKVLDCEFARAMFCLARLDDKDLHGDFVNKCVELENALSQVANLNLGIDVEENAQTLKKLRSLDINTFSINSNTAIEPITYCLQPLLAVEVLLNPSADTQFFVNQLLLIQRLKCYSLSRLCSELIRACLLCLRDALGGNDESHWGAFTFLKLPQILLKLHSNKGSVGEDYSQDIIEAMEMVLQFTALLDTLDVKSTCNVVECLASELHRVGLISEKQAQAFAAKREGAVSSVIKIDPNSQQAAGTILKVIVRAEPTLAKILTTLDSDYLNNQAENLLGVLSQVLTGKSFELILAVATVEDKLRTFVSKLINFNELSRVPGVDEASSGKGSLTRAMLFDVSFLMLCSIVQSYGSEVVLNEDGTPGNSFFEKWVNECMAEKGHPKSPDQMLSNCDMTKLDALLTQFTAPDAEFKTNQVKWHEVCQLVPAATKELLFAWEQGALSPTDVKLSLDNMRSRMGCLPVCAASWLCSYMQILDHDALLKPMNMVQQFLTPTDDMPQQDNYKERSNLMFQIIRKMQYDIHPPLASKTKLSHNIVSGLPISEQLVSVWNSTHKKGWINVEATNTLESLILTGGPLWFVTNVVKEVLSYRCSGDLDKAVDLAFGIFHLDIESCTLNLVQHLLPIYLHNKNQGGDLVEPQASAIARLCAYCIFAALEFGSNQVSGQPSTRKRARMYSDAEDLESMVPAAKMLRLGSTDSQSEASASLMFVANSASQAAVPDDSNTSNLPMIKEPLKTALQKLFETFSFIAQDGRITQHKHFLLRFLEFCVLCGKEKARIVFQVMPSNLVPNLLSSLPDWFSYQLLLQLYDTSTSSGRRDTARDLCMLRNMSLQPPPLTYASELTSKSG